MSLSFSETISSAFHKVQANPHYLWLAFAGFCIVKVVRFCRADADLNLLSKKRLPKDAFEDKVVWITGASQGLGEELALQFADAGAYLILSSRSTDKLKKVKAKCGGKHGREAILLPLDLTDPLDKLEEAANSALEAFGSSASGIHYLVHNAGASQRSPVEEASAESVENLYELNVNGTLRLTQVILPRLLEQASKGDPAKFIVVGSLAGQVPAPGQAVYAACKASLDAYFRSLHSELWTRGVTATLCHPGPIATGIEGQPRSLYGPEGLITHTESSSSGKSRQSTSRVASLILKAAYNNVDSCWISTQPLLLAAYLVRFWPKLGYWLVNKVGPKRASSYKEGGSGYDFQKLGKTQ